MKNIPLTALLLALAAIPHPVCDASPAEPTAPEAPRIAPEGKEQTAEPKSLRILLDSAAGYFDLCLFHEAIRYYEAALILDPQNQEAKDGIERANDRLSQYYASKYQQPDIPQPGDEMKANAEVLHTLMNYAIGYYDLGLHDEALQLFEAVLILDPQNEEAKKGIRAIDHCKYGPMPRFSAP